MKDVLNRIQLWWKARGERLCAKDSHAWKSCKQPASADFIIGLYYDWAYCKRCGKLGRRLPEG